MSNWSLPTTITQYSEEGAESVHVPWREVNNSLYIKGSHILGITTSKDLLHIARDPRHDVLQKTYFLKMTGFDFSNFDGPVTGIELKLTINRGGRITDDTVQLCLENLIIGKNLGSRNLDPEKIYGDENDTWETTLSAQNIKDPTFGIILRFQSHPDWPHRSSPIIDAVELRIH